MQKDPPIRVAQGPGHGGEEPQVQGLTRNNILWILAVSEGDGSTQGRPPLAEEPFRERGSLMPAGCELQYQVFQVERRPQDVEERE